MVRIFGTILYYVPMYIVCTVRLTFSDSDPAATRRDDYVKKQCQNFVPPPVRLCTGIYVVPT